MQNSEGEGKGGEGRKKGKYVKPVIYISESAIRV